MPTNEELRQLLDELPARGQRSRLDPFRELIVEMKQRQYSYREISRFLVDRCGIGISHNAVRNYLNRRFSESPAPLPPRANGADVGTAGALKPALPEPLRSEQPQAVRDRIATLKRQSKLTSSPDAGFRFDPAQPLRLPDE